MTTIGTAKVDRRALARASARREGFAWGRPPKKAIALPVPAKKPARLRIVTSIERIAYRTSKGSLRNVTFEHPHKPPFPLLAAQTSPENRARSTRSGKAAILAKGALFELGSLVDVAGHDTLGREVTFVPPRGAYLLAGDARNRMHVLGKKGGIPSLFVLTNRSPYTITDRGIER